MKILHVSDTHGYLPTLPAGDYDVIVHSGDLLPNRSFGNKPVEESFQARWIEENAAKLRAWIGTGRRRFLYTPGNHDYVDPTQVLRDLGVDARLLVGALDVDGVRFWGHPWTPEFCGWNWMCGPEEMREHLEPVVDLLEQAGGIDVFVSHGPMFGVLDRNAQGTRCGSHELREVMQNAKHLPRFLLHGHIHEAQGVAAWPQGMIVSNAATTWRVMGIEPEQRPGQAAPLPDEVVEARAFVLDEVCTWLSANAHKRTADLLYSNRNLFLLARPCPTKPVVDDGKSPPKPLANDELRACWCFECLDAPEHGFHNPTARRMILCPACGNKRCPRATDHRLACTDSNHTGQWGSSYGHRVDVVDRIPRDILNAVRDALGTPENADIIRHARDLRAKAEACTDYPRNEHGEPEDKVSREGWNAGIERACEAIENMNGDPEVYRLISSLHLDPEVGARVTPRDWKAIAEAALVALKTGETLTTIRQRFGLDPCTETPRSLTTEKEHVQK